MTQFRLGAMDPFDIVWKNLFDQNAQFSTHEHKINYPVDIYEVESGLIFELAVVGLNQEDLNILIEGDTLRITHDRKVAEGEENRPYIQKGIARRSFDLAWKIASKFELNKLEAMMDKGLLIIHIPYSAEKALKKIEIKAPSHLK